MSDSFYSFLRGTWKVKRSVFDSNKKPQGLLIGEAKYKPYGSNALTFEENLEGLFDNHCGRAWNKQEISFRSPTEANIFQKGEYFHNMKFNRPFNLIHYTCKDDQYLGLFVFHRESRSFSVTWRVKGPKKNYSLRAYYEKLAK